MISYLAARGAETIMLHDDVLAHIGRYLQRRASATEAGGQLFARFEPGKIIVEAATGPNCLDRRTRFSFVPSNFNAKRAIRAMHKRGLHYVGDWHTHPEPVPHPSGDDRNAISDAFRQSRHHLQGFLMVIAGNTPAPKGLYVAIADGRELHQLTLDTSCSPQSGTEFHDGPPHQRPPGNIAKTAEGHRPAQPPERQ